MQNNVNIIAVNSSIITPSSFIFYNKWNKFITHIYMMSKSLWSFFIIKRKDLISLIVDVILFTQYFLLKFLKITYMYICNTQLAGRLAYSYNPSFWEAWYIIIILFMTQIEKKWECFTYILIFTLTIHLF